MTERAEEREWVAKALGGNPDAYRHLFREHTPAIFRTALRYLNGSEADAEDVVQECWRRAVVALSKFGFRSSFRTWITGIAVRCALEALRKRHPNEFSLDETSLPAGESTRSGEPTTTAIDLERTMKEMPAGFRAILLLYEVEGHTHEEIGKLLDISPGTSKSQLSRGRKWIRQTLGDDYGVKQ